MGQAAAARTSRYTAPIKGHGHAVTLEHLKLFGPDHALPAKYVKPRLQLFRPAVQENDAIVEPSYLLFH
jgi:hypothetical protein